MSGRIDELEGRALFGIDPRNYDQIRPVYPEPLYDFLLASGALRSGASTLEIGPGNGLATRRLLDLGANPLTVVEPDRRFVPMLRSLASGHEAEFRCIESAFEDADLPLRHYDLVVAATSFHWIQPSIGLAKAAAVLKPGGYLALWWHVFGDMDREDPWHEATWPILQSLASSPSGAPNTVPYAMDARARFRDFANTGQFEVPEHVAYRWTFVLNAEQVGALYATYSHISRLPETQRIALLSRLVKLAETDFGGIVERHVVTPVYVARRR